MQYDVIRMLALPENNLFIVGDDDQSIYRFRGARPEIMLGFSKDYPNAKSIILDVNYRSTKAVVSAARRVIERNKNRYQKEIITVNEQGDNVHIQEVRHPVEESHYVREQIAKAVAAGTEPISDCGTISYQYGAACACRDIHGISYSISDERASSQSV